MQIKSVVQVLLQNVKALNPHTGQYLGHCQPLKSGQELSTVARNSRHHGTKKHSLWYNQFFTNQSVFLDLFEMIYIFSGMHNYFFEILAQNHMQNMMFSRVQVGHTNLKKKLLNTAQIRTALYSPQPQKFRIMFDSQFWNQVNVRSTTIADFNLKMYG